MTGVLNYVAPGVANRRGRTFGIVSTCLASCVFAIPAAVTAAAAIVSGIFERPGNVPVHLNVGLLLIFIPTLAMLILPLLGVMFGTVGMMTDRRRVCECSRVGLIVNTGALISVVYFVLTQ